MKPYYEQDGITIYHGDCREVIPIIPVAEVGAVVSDPPYGIGHVHSGKGAHAHKTGQGRRNTQRVAGDAEPFDPTHLFRFENLLLWGANHYAKRLPDGGRWLAWDKLDGMKVEDSFSDVEFAWHSRGRASRIINYAWKGVASVKVGEDNGRRWHPTQKPLGVMRWSIALAGVKHGLILDPYMGAGATLVAAKDMGLRAVGIELEERYCEVAAKRLAQGVLFGAA